MRDSIKFVLASMLGAAIVLAVVAMGGMQPVSAAEPSQERVNKFADEQWKEILQLDAQQLEQAKTYANLPRPTVASASDFVFVMSPSGRGWVVNREGIATVVQAKVDKYKNDVNFMSSSFSSYLTTRLICTDVLRRYPEEEKPNSSSQSPDHGNKP